MNFPPLVVIYRETIMSKVDGVEVFFEKGAQMEVEVGDSFP